MYVQGKIYIIKFNTTNLKQNRYSYNFIYYYCVYAMLVFITESIYITVIKPEPFLGTF